MSNLVEIQNQIEKLQKQAKEIKSREFDKTVRDILATMEAFGITIKDLGAKKFARSQRQGEEATAWGHRKKENWRYRSAEIPGAGWRDLERTRDDTALAGGLGGPG